MAADHRISRIVRLLEGMYGRRPRRRFGDPLGGLIATVLSRHTSDINSHNAYKNLRRAFRTWRECMSAPVRNIEQSIRCGGLAGQKAKSIQAILRQLKADRGRLSLDFLGRWPLERARQYLLSLPGVGPKTAACVLLFHLGKPALPVDTHVHRLSRKLGLIADDASAEEAHYLLEPLCPKRLIYPFHVLLIQHGREICRARRPCCDECVLSPLCPSRLSFKS